MSIKICTLIFAVASFVLLAVLSPLTYQSNAVHAQQREPIARPVIPRRAPTRTIRPVRGFPSSLPKIFDIGNTVLRMDKDSPSWVKYPAKFPISNTEDVIKDNSHHGLG